MLSIIVAKQVFIMFLLIMLGFVLTKKEFINESGGKQITNILVYAVTPCVLVNAYQREFKPELVSGLITAAILTIIIHALAIFLCHFIFRNDGGESYRICRFGSVYSNCGFMAIPLLSAALGDEGVFYGSAYLAVFTMIYWSVGIYTLTENKDNLSVKSIFVNPGIIGTTFALILFLFQITLPELLGQTVDFVASMNTPLSMITLGIYLAKLQFKRIAKSKKLYSSCAVRLILIPVITLFIIKIFPINDIAGKVILISSACPAAAVTTLFASKYNMNATFAAGIVSLSTILSIITIPIIVLFA